MAVRSMRGCAVVPFGGVRIDRKTRWGNPFTMAHESEREGVLSRYRACVTEEIRLGRISREDLAALHGKDLYCWCSPKACHGNILAELAAWAAGEAEGRGWPP